MHPAKQRNKMANTQLRLRTGSHADWSRRMRACLDAARMASPCFIARSRSDLIISLSARRRHRTSQLTLEERLEEEHAGVLGEVRGRTGNVLLMFQVEARDPRPMCKRLSVIGDITCVKCTSCREDFCWTTCFLSACFVTSTRKVVVKSHTEKC